MLCDSSNLHKQKFVKPKPLASKMAAVGKVGQKNGEVGLLVEYLFCGLVKSGVDLCVRIAKYNIFNFGENSNCPSRFAPFPGRRRLDKQK